MLYEWDVAKELANRRKHLLGFELAAQALADPERLELSQMIDGEARYFTLCRIGTHVLTVVFTEREDEDGHEICRIISARKATRAERERYFQGEV